MPEGPEVRRHADAVHAALAGHRIVAATARTKQARAYLGAHDLAGRTVERVWAHGKHLVGQIGALDDAPPVFWHSHLMMWGRWETHPAGYDESPDPRERARIATDGGVAILRSAPVFELHEGADPYALVEALATLGPDILPYDGPQAFDAEAFRVRLAAHSEAEIGAVLLDQRVVAGIGNYLRADLLFLARLSPFRRVADLSEEELQRIVDLVPGLAVRAYEGQGVTLAPEDVDRVASDDALVYTPGALWQRRHYVFRRTNLPCLACGTPVRQLRQVTRAAEAEGEDDKTRPIYFCPTCQDVPMLERKAPRKKRPPADAATLADGAAPAPASTYDGDRYAPRTTIPTPDA